MNRLHQLLHLGFDVVNDQFHRAGAVDHQHHVEAFAPQLADETAKARADAVTVARAHAAATTDADTTAAGCAHVVVGETDGLRRINRRRLFHLLRRRVGHWHFGHVEILHLVAATAAAARFEVHHDQLAPALLVDRDDKNEQQRDMKGDRQRERTDQESDGAADGRPESTGFLASLVGIDGFNGFDFRRERGRGADRIRSRECGELALA